MSSFGWSRYPFEETEQEEFPLFVEDPYYDQFSDEMEKVYFRCKTSNVIKKSTYYPTKMECSWSPNNIGRKYVNHTKRPLPFIPRHMY